MCAARTPVEEMSQLVRIMLRLMPSSADLLPQSTETRVLEPEIRAYLGLVLGDQAPQPEWGLPNADNKGKGWGAYLAELFSWALGIKVSIRNAMQCVRRQPGMTWEARRPELHRLGLFPERWTFPLSQQQVVRANQDGAAEEEEHAEERAEEHAEERAEPSSLLAFVRELGERKRMRLL